MTHPDAANLLYLRASRKIIPNDSLTSFLRKVHEEVYDDGFAGFEADVEPLVYAADSLRATLFERRIRAGMNMTEMLKKVHDYLESPTHTSTTRVRQRPGGPLVSRKVQRKNPLPALLASVESDHLTEKGLLPPVRAIDIADCTKEDYKHLGTELALVIEEGTVASVLQAQSGLIYAAAIGTVAGQHLPRPAEPDQPLQIPFMHAPFKTETDRDEFMDALRPQLPVYGLEMRSILFHRASTFS